MLSDVRTLELYFIAGNVIIVLVPILLDLSAT